MMTTDPPTSTGHSPSSIENDGGGTTSKDSSAVPRRYIYNQADMEHFRHSTSRKELLSFVTAMGRGLTTNINDNTNNNQILPHGGYNSHTPLVNLSPALASLHGSLTCISQTWMDPNSDGIPPDLKVKARFGNPAFRTWHARLVERSYGIVRCLMDCHVKYSLPSISDDGDDNDDDSNITDSNKITKEQILKECYDQGYRAATNEGNTLWPHDDEQSADSLTKQEEIIEELRAYLHDGFGHPIRIDYGTGHESSFIVFLLSLCKIGCFSWGDTSDNKGNTGENIKPNHQSPQAIGLGSLSIFHAYLKVTRGLQRDYMLEPAGSHGVWGLDDYHCVPFYLGACQMIAREQWQQQNQQSKKNKKGSANKGEPISQHDSAALDSEDEAAKRMPDTPYLPETTSPVTDQTTPLFVDAHQDNDDHWTPSVIHNKQIMETHRHTYLYLSCIHFIQEIKPNVPFFESSPMLNDISHIGNWTKVSSGLLRLYEGEVLDKMPVVQHFVFGNIFSANWTPSRTSPLVAPKSTFVHMGGEECVAPWAVGGDSGSAYPSAGSTHPGGMPPTRAPWAK